MTKVKPPIATRRAIAKRLCAAIEKMLRFVEENGPLEGEDENGNWWGQMSRGISSKRLSYLETLDGTIGRFATHLKLKLLPWSPYLPKDNEWLLSFTRLRLSHLVIKGKCVEANRVFPTPDWKYRMESLLLDAQRIASKPKPGRGDSKTNEELTWPPSESWHHQDGQFAVAGIKPFTVPGIPGEVLALLIADNTHSVTREQLKARIPKWNKSNVSIKTINQTTSRLRSILKSKLRGIATENLLKCERSGSTVIYELVTPRSKCDQKD